MRTQRWMKWTAVCAVACGLTATTLVVKAHAAAPPGGLLGGEFPAHGRFLERLASLGITEDQRDKIRAILREAQPKAQPLVKQFVMEKRAMRSLVLKGASETEIRAQAAKVAAVGTDLAVLKAQVAPQIRAVLTPEQQKKVEAMIEEFDGRVDTIVDRVGQHLEKE